MKPLYAGAIAPLFFVVFLRIGRPFDAREIRTDRARRRQACGGGAAGLRRLMAAPAATKVLHLINGEFYAGAERVQDLLALRLPALRL